MLWVTSEIKCYSDSKEDWTNRHIMGAFIRKGTGWDSKLYASGLKSFINSKELETRLFKAVILADRERIVDLFIMLLT